MPKKVLINDPIINELTYDAIYHATREDRQKLSQKQLRLISTERRAKQFSISSTLDEKLILLAKFGLSYVIKIGKKSALTPKHLKNLYEKYKDNVGQNCIDEMLENTIAVTTDRHVSMFHNMLGNVCHSDNYMLNRDFYKVGHHLLNWQESSHLTNEQIKETDDYISIINKHALNIAMALKEVKGLTQIADLDLNILMFLFKSRNAYVEREKLLVFFKTSYKPIIITTALKRLIENFYIEKSPDHIYVEYMITSLGIDTVMAFHRKILTDTLNY